MIHVLPKFGRLCLGPLMLCLAFGAQGQEEQEAEEQLEESSAEELSVYETLVFDRPFVVLAGQGPKAGDENNVSTYAETGDELDPEQVLNLRRFEQAVSDIELAGGAWDVNLTENLSSMGEIYQQQGMHEEAVDSYGRAMHVSRVNLGLKSLEHLPFVERMVDSYLALGDWESADQYQEYLYNILRREYGLDDPRMVPVLHKRASWELSLFNARWGDELGSKLINALFLYRTASNLVSVYFGPNDQRYENYLRDTAGAAYLVSRYQTLIRETTQVQYRGVQDSFVDGPRGFGASYDDGYTQGLEALQRIVASFTEQQRTSVDYVEALLLEADWYLLFDRRRAAQARYGEAYAIIAARPDGEALIGSMFGVVKPLPAFSEEIESILTTSNYQGRAMIARESGHIDVQFDITPYGAVTDLEVLTDDSGIDGRVVSSLRRRIRTTMFRPVIEDGELVRSSGNRFRYRYAY
jgi:tetratricopeptide (TPR) repeat protein